MKRHTLIAGIIGLFLGNAIITGCGQANTSTTTAGSTKASTPPPASAGEMTTYVARSGSKMRIEGTANIIHPTWQIESPIIGGWMQVGAGFPMEPGQAVTPGNLMATNNVFIQVRSLKSVKEDGNHYDDRMDEVTWEHLKAEQYKQILYRLTSLVLKEAAKGKDGTNVCEAKGDLTISGVTSNVTMLVYIRPFIYTNATTGSTEKRLEIKGSVPVKMTDYKVAPVDINLVLGHIKTGDEVKLVFTWILGQKKETTSTP
jgi:hypothetical protein